MCVDGGECCVVLVFLIVLGSSSLSLQPARMDGCGIWRAVATYSPTLHLHKCMSALHLAAPCALGVRGQDCLKQHVLRRLARRLATLLFYGGLVEVALFAFSVGLSC